MSDKIEKLAQAILHEPEFIQVGEKLPAARVTHAGYPVEPHLKTSRLMILINGTDTESVLVDHGR